MGEVYRARDTRLDRTVAIKILPAHLSANAEARQRFEREAKAISSLSHPNICHLYDVGAQDSVHYLVMEYLEGETLADRLKKGAMPLEQLVRCAVEIASGLEKAHRSGVIHRDLKPGNIMLTKAGAKLMDFGLAKSGTVVTASQPEEGLTQSLSPTLGSPTPPLTAQGTVVGTFQYMSPEQVEGKETDARSDIFSLGAVLYEMATGKRAFEGKTAASSMAAVLEREPAPISSIQPMTPPALERVVKKCLAKDPDERWQSAGDLASELRWIAEAAPASSAQAALAMAPIQSSRKRELLAWTLAFLGFAGAIGLGVFHFASREPQRVLRAQIAPPENVRFNFVGDNAGPPVISPDGTHMVYSANAEGKNQLYVRSMDSLLLQLLPGTEDAIFPFWSPDSRSVGFFSNGKLRRIDISGGPPLTLCDAPVGRGGSWGPGGVILFTPNFGAPLFQVSASGGTRVAVTKLEARYTTHRWPWFLPDGRHFLYLAANHNDPSSADTALFLASLDGKENRLLVLTPSSGIYVSGYLLFVRNNALLAQSLDVSALQLKGEPAVITDNVQVDDGVWRGTFTASENGTLLYEPGTGGTGMALTWADRSGKQTRTVGGRDAFREAQISPDGKKLALSIGQPLGAVWTYDLTRNVKARLTFGKGNYDDVAWSPDGSQIAYTALGGSEQAGTIIWSKASSGAGGETQLLVTSDNTAALCDWSPDGRYIIYHTGTPATGTGIDLWTLPLFGDRKPAPYVTAPGDQDYAQFSPDGRWVAYSSRETTTWEVYVAPFPWTGAKWQVSTNGGTWPRWRRDGKELYYFTVGSSQITAAEVNTHGPTFELGPVHPLFAMSNISANIESIQYAVSADGQRFLFVTTGAAASQPLTLVQNWTGDLRKK
jgi:serine/threonine protein kinase